MTKDKVKNILKKALHSITAIIIIVALVVASGFSWYTYKIIQENNDLQRFVKLSQLDFDARVNEAASAIKTIMQDEVSDEDRFKLGATIVKHSSRLNLDHLDVVAVIKHESNFNTNAVSDTGDYGLMQINWYWVGQHYFKDKKELFDTENNIKLGCEQLVMWREHVRKTKGGKKEIFNHYNSGWIIENNTYGNKVSAIRKKL